MDGVFEGGNEESQIDAILSFSTDVTYLKLVILNEKGFRLEKTFPNFFGLALRKIVVIYLAINDSSGGQLWL